MARIIFAIFFLSGAAALTFEVVWFRQAGLALGNTVWAMALVVSGFMGGLALGNALVARHGHRITSPLRFYVVMELVVGLSGLALVLLLPLLSQWLMPVFSGLLDQPLMLNSLRLAISFSLMLIPTTAMGVTLPILVKELSYLNPNFGSILGRLYGWNTLGAMFGVLFAELVLIQYLGLLGTGLTAMLFNFLVAYIALRLAGARKEAPATSAHADYAVGEFGLATLSVQSKRLLGAAALAGAIMLALEVVWFRFLLLFYPGTSAVFAIMLTIILAGIGLGGLLAGSWYRRADRAHDYLRQITLVAGIAVVLTYWFFDQVFFFAVDNIGNETIFTFVAFASFLMLPVSIISGMLFTLLGRAARFTLETETRTAGLLTLANTLGAMAGALIGGFILLPFVGMEMAILLLAASYGLVSILIPVEGGSRNRFLRYATVAAFLACITFFPFGHMNRNVFSVVDLKFYGGERVAVREGLTETAILYQYDRHGEPYYHRLSTNGFSMSGTRVKSLRYMKLYVYWPIALHPDLKNALLISYGVGSTANALTNTRQLERIDIVDISKEVLSLSDLIFTETGDNPLLDERVDVHIEDGRFYLQSTDRRYDLITSEPPPPKIAGIVNLYTQEYFEAIRSRLNEGGITTYWLPVHQLAEEETLSIIKGFCNAFDDCSLWAGAGLDWMLIGTRNATGTVTEEHFRRQWEDNFVSPELRLVGLEEPAQLGALFMADARYLQLLTQHTLPLTDNYPGRLTDELVDYRERSALYAELMDVRRARDAFSNSAFIDTIWPKEQRLKSLEFFPYQRMLTEHLEPAYRTPNTYFWEDLRHVLTHSTLHTLPLWLVGSSWKEQDILSDLGSAAQKTNDALLAQGLDALARRDYGRAAGFIESSLKSTDVPGTSRTWKLYLFALAMDGNWSQAEQIGNRVFADAGGSTEQLYWKWMRNTFGGD